MNILIDTNIVIPLEPTSSENLHENTKLMAEFFRLATKAKRSLFYHPCIQSDLERDKDPKRVELRRELLKKYHELPDAPFLDGAAPSELQGMEYGTNDWVDGNLLLAVLKNAVAILVTNDEGIHKKAKKLGLEDRVKRSEDVLQELRDFYDVTPSPPPAVIPCKAHVLNEKDPIFDSLRADYPGFEKWLTKTKLEHRQCFMIEGVLGSDIAGFCIIKPEEINDYGFGGKVLKLSTFKISDRYVKNRYGELLLKPVFDFLSENDYDHVYVTVLEKYPELIEYLLEFGFQDSGHRTELSERVLLKRLKWTPIEKASLMPLEFNRIFGPWKTKFENNRSYLIPIKPKYHDLLFPEIEIQHTLFPSRPCGNSIRKAYLSNSKIKKIEPGNNIFFYRSTDLMAITALGIVEEIKISNDPDEIEKYVGDRTVYSYEDIEDMCKTQVLAIKFKRVMFFNSPIGYTELKLNNVLKGRPQSILEIQGEGLQWLKTKTGM